MYDVAGRGGTSESAPYKRNDIECVWDQRLIRARFGKVHPFLINPQNVFLSLETIKIRYSIERFVGKFK